MKKILIGLTLAGLFVGCGSKEEDSETSYFEMHGERPWKNLFQGTDKAQIKMVFVNAENKETEDALSANFCVFDQDSDGTTSSVTVYPINFRQVKSKLWWYSISDAAWTGFWAMMTLASSGSGVVPALVSAGELSADSKATDTLKRIEASGEDGQKVYLENFETMQMVEAIKAVGRNRYVSTLSECGSYEDYDYFRENSEEVSQ